MPRRTRDRAVRYNQAQHYPMETVVRIQEMVGSKPDGAWGPVTTQAVRDWQASVGLTADGMFGPSARAEVARRWAETRKLTRDEMLDIVEPTIRHESGGRMDATNRDGEFEGRFDKPGRTHWASRNGDNPTHVGLSLGPIQVTQDGGSLGLWLQLVWDSNPELVRNELGSKAEHILTMLTTKKTSGDRKVVRGLGPGRRSPRVMPVAGNDLWESPWVDRLRSLARTPEGGDAFEEVTVDRYFEPQLELAQEYGLMSGGDLAVVVDIAVQYGGGGCRKRMRRAGKVNGVLDVDDLIDELDPARRPRRYRVYNSSEWWVTYTL